MSDPRELLASILRDWTRTDEAESVVRARLRGRVDPGLASSSLLHIPIGQWSVVSPMAVRSGTAKALVEDVLNPWPMLAVLDRRDDGWVLTSFRSQCSSCLGSGVDVDSVCELCFGEGWTA